MKLNRLVLNLVVFLLLIGLVFAWTPQNNVDLIWEYNINNATNITAESFFGDGSSLTGITAGDTNETTRVNNLVGTACGSGDFVKNFSTDGTPQCDTPAGSGDITSVQGDNIYIYNGSDSSGVQLGFNETTLNSTIDGRLNYTSGDGNITISSSNKISFTSSVLTWLQNLFIESSEESSLNVNSSNYWDALNTPLDIETMSNFTACDVNVSCNLYVGTIQATDGNSIYIQPTGDTDDYFSFKTPAHRPTIKREGGKYIYIDSSNIYDVGVSLRYDDDYSGTLNYEKDNKRFTLLGKNSSIGIKANSGYDHFVLFETYNNQPQISAYGSDYLLLNDSLKVNGIVNATAVYDDGVLLTPDTNCTTGNSCPLITYDSELAYIPNCSSDGSCSLITYDSELSASNVNYSVFANSTINDADTTYSAGTNLTLTDTAFSIATGFYTWLDNTYFSKSGDNVTGNVNINTANVTIDSTYFYCLNADCSSYMTNNGTGVVIT